MKYLIMIAGVLAVAFSGIAAGEGSQSLSSTLEIYVFPTEGQSSDQQSMDEVECYNWAVSNTGSDPFDLQKQDEAVTAQAEQQVAQTKAATQGGGGRSAVRGAAAGALIGEVSGGDAGDSAAMRSSQSSGRPMSSFTSPTCQQLSWKWLRQNIRERITKDEPSSR